MIAVIGNFKPVWSQDAQCYSVTSYPHTPRKPCGCPECTTCNCDGSVKGGKSLVALSEALGIVKQNRAGRRRKQGV